jgi:hypothetical protein
MFEGCTGPWRSMSVYFFMKPSSFANVFPFPVCKAQLIGDWCKNGRGERNTIIFHGIRQYYLAHRCPCGNSKGGPNTKKKLLVHCAWSALPIGGGGHRCANILAHRCPPRQYWRTEHKNLFRNVRILSRQGEATNGSFGAFFMLYAYSQANRLLT